MTSLEFKSEVQLSMDLGESTNFGMSYNHVSNASLGIKTLGQTVTCLIFLKSFKFKNYHEFERFINFNDFRKLAKKITITNISLY